MTDYPIFINCRDRVTPLRALVGWLERAGCTRIHLVDNESTYPPLLDYYASTPHHVIRLGRNQGHRAVWESGAVDEHAPGEYYVATDPDIVPVEECPPDALEHFRALLDRHPDRAKVGFGLRTDDLPRHYRFSDQVRRWEGQFWSSEVEPGVYDAPIDTTFALHRPGTAFTEPGLLPSHARSLRTGPPYLARHTAWYVDSRHPDAEERYYRDHARSDVTHWNGDRLPRRLIEGMRAAGMRVDGGSSLWRRLLPRRRGA
ncbi:MAG TPA: glycosyltransferase family 2 protein [Candidatus Dormibacteraeota bacterium]|jgi:hypothetical protein|nr:glycosyltransferase family 2 protein [Candidatus Dormibacteraeota bacterium]